MGGRGTFKFAVNYPEKFAAAAVMSACPENYSGMTEESLRNDSVFLYASVYTSFRAYLCLLYLSLRAHSDLILMSLRALLRKIYWSFRDLSEMRR